MQSDLYHDRCKLIYGKGDIHTRKKSHSICILAFLIKGQFHMRKCNSGFTTDSAKIDWRPDLVSRENMRLVVIGQDSIQNKGEVWWRLKWNIIQELTRSLYRVQRNYSQLKSAWIEHFSSDSLVSSVNMTHRMHALLVSRTDFGFHQWWHGYLCKLMKDINNFWLR